MKSLNRQTVLLIVLALALAGAGYYYYTTYVAAPAEPQFTIDPPTDTSTTDTTGAGTTPNSASTTDTTGAGSGSTGSTGIGTSGAGTNGASTTTTTTTTTTSGSTALTNGSATGNSRHSLNVAQLAVNAASKSKLTITATAFANPVMGGAATGKAARTAYGKKVTSATITITFADATSEAEWKKATAAVKTSVVKGFLALVARNYPNASVSTTVLSSMSTPLAYGDRTAGGQPTVKVVG